MRDDARFITGHRFSSVRRRDLQQGPNWLTLVGQTLVVCLWPAAPYPAGVAAAAHRPGAVFGRHMRILL